MSTIARTLDAAFRPSLRAKLLFIMLCVSAAVVAVGAVGVAIRDVRASRQGVELFSSLTQRLVAEYCVAPLVFGYSKEASDALEKLRLLQAIEETCIYDKQGQVFASYRRADLPRGAPFPPAVFRQEQVIEKDHVVSHQPIAYKGELRGAIYMRTDVTGYVQALHQQMATLAPAAILLLLLAFPIGVRLQRLVSDPIEKLGRATRHLAESRDYSLRLEVTGSDEVAQVYRTFNDLCAQLEAQQAATDEAQQRILELNERLEERVRLRTAELEAANRELVSARDAAETANRAKSQFLANMSHEIRTPMSALIGLTDLTLQTRMSPKQEHYLKNIQTAGRSLLALVNDILDFSKIEAGQLLLESVEFDLGEVLGALENQAALVARDKGLEVAFLRADGVPSRLVGDPLRLEQILNNLVDNALKFTERGSVTVRVAARDPEPERVTLEFSVVDTGLGIPANQLERIFDAFTQADASTTRKFGGTGLGLSIVKRLVHLLGGEVRVRSEPGAGSSFSFTARFGLAKRSSQGRPGDGSASSRSLLAASPETGRKLSGRRVLVVEDNEINQFVACEMLEHAGMSVSAARNGEEALAALERTRFDAVLMDMQMPSMDGYEATRRIRARPELAGLPVIAVTAHAMTGDRERCLEAGVDDYVTKPLDARLILAILARRLAPDSAGRALAEVAGEGAAEPLRVDEDLAKLGHIDAADGLARLGGDGEAYRRILSRFRRQFVGFAAALRKTFAEGLRQDVRDRLHSLKGVVGNIGAAGASRAISELEEALSSEDAARQEESIERLQRELEETLSELRALEEARPPKEPAARDGERSPDPASSGWRTMLDEARVLLRLGDTKARHAVHDLLPGLRSSAAAELVPVLEAALTRYAFGDALHTLDEIERRLRHEPGKA